MRRIVEGTLLQGRVVESEHECAVERHGRQHSVDREHDRAADGDGEVHEAMRRGTPRVARAPVHRCRAITAAPERIAAQSPKLVATGPASALATSASNA